MLSDLPQVSVSCTDCSDADVESGVCRHTENADGPTTDTAVDGNSDATDRTTSYKDAIGTFVSTRWEPYFLPLTAIAVGNFV